MIWFIMGFIALMWLIIEHKQTGQGMQPITVSDLPIIIFVICLGPISLIYMIADTLHQKGII